jgi:regulatory protein CII
METKPDVKEVRLAKLIDEAIEGYGGRKELAFKLGTNKHTMNGQLNPFNARNAFQVKLLLNLIPETLPHSIGAVQFIAGLANGVFVPIPAIPANDSESLKEQFLKTSEELGDVASVLRDASAPDSPGGREIVLDEYPQLIKELKDVAIVIFEMLFALGVYDRNSEVWNCGNCFSLN